MGSGGNGGPSGGGGNGSALVGGAARDSAFSGSGGGGYVGGGGSDSSQGGGGGSSYVAGLTSVTVNLTGSGGTGGYYRPNPFFDFVASGNGLVQLSWSLNVPTTSSVNLTISCLSTIFSGYDGGARGYNLLAYTGIRFSDGSYGPTIPPVSMSSFLGKSAYNDGGGTYTLQYNESVSHDFGSVANGESKQVNVYTEVGQTFEVLLNGASQTPDDVYLTVSDSSSRTITITGNSQFTVPLIPLDPDKIVQVQNSTPGAGVFTAIATVAGTMTDANNRTFLYSYTVDCSFTSSGGSGI
jgi:hypothetical protein